MGKETEIVNRGIVIPSWVATTISNFDDVSLGWFLRGLLEYHKYIEDTGFEGKAPVEAITLFNAWCNWNAEEAEKKFLKMEF